MPDIAATSYGTVFPIIVSNLDSVQDPLRCRDLIRPHDHQHLFGREDTVFGQDIENRMPRKESPCKINQIRNHLIVCVCPEGCEFEAVTGLFFLLLAGFRILDGVEAGAVGIILRIRSVGDHKDLDVLKETRPSPERIALISVDLIERLADRYPAPL